MAVITQDKITLQSAKAINDKAEAAQTLAGNTNQHFWFTSQGTDTGAHITEVTQEDFLADPTNGGSNLLARSNGIAIRDGLTELASFGATGAVIGQVGNSQMIITNKAVKGVSYNDTQTFELGTITDNEWIEETATFDSSGFTLDVRGNSASYKDFVATYPNGTTEVIASTYSLADLLLSSPFNTNVLEVHRLYKAELGSIPVTTSSVVEITTSTGVKYSPFATTPRELAYGWLTIDFIRSSPTISTRDITKIEVDGVEVPTFEYEDIDPSTAITRIIFRKTFPVGTVLSYKVRYTTDANFYTFGNRSSNARIGDYSLTLGEDDAKASGKNSIAVGNGFAYGTNSIAVGQTDSSGYLSLAGGGNSFALGTGVQNRGDNSIAFGNGVQSYSNDGLAFGKFNEWWNQSTGTTKDLALQIGNGSDYNNLSNALEVDWNGNVVASGDITDGSGHTLSNIGKVFSSSRSVAITVANINTYAEGASLTLPKGTYIVHGSFTFNSATGARVTDIDICNVGGSTAASGTGLYARQRVAQGAGNWVRLETSCIVVLTAQSPVYVKGSATLTSTAQASEITAVRIA